MENNEQNKKKIDKSRPLVEILNLTKEYKNKVALNKVNLTINPGDRIGIIGANGSGKSTLSEIIGGIRKPTSGEIIRQEHLVNGLQFQESRYPAGISLMDMIKYYLHTFNISMKEDELLELLKTYQLLGIENKFIQTLSGGQQQRLNILLAVIHDPDLVILDEVSTGLDIEVRSEIFEFFRKNIIDKNKTMILVTHNMSEVEEFYEKYIYIHNGVIKEAGNVKDIVKKYGSVHNFTWKMFDKNKKADLKKQYEEIKKENAEIKKNKKKNKWIHKAKMPEKSRPLINLMFKYYYRGFFVPFFLVLFPILMLFLEGFAFKQMEGDTVKSLHTLVGSISMLQPMAVGIFIIPQTIVEFKNSVLMKRIGATNIKPIFFVFSVMIIGFFFMIATFLWSLLWVGIMFGGTYGWSNIVTANFIGESIPFIILIFFSSMGLGMLLASIFKSVTALVAASNVIYFPVTLLSGVFFPAELINSSPVLKYATYFNPFKYAMDPFIQAWSGTSFTFTTTYGIYLGVALGLIGIYTIVASSKLRWQA
ncbi:ABC transporter ATP-binding protein/permease [Spiroplasma endosymbiont of Thecophora atra]|uniref:ABC transporter ATP-binding protein/permease n=1 Tax=Spiroplasma endosymbiont of Thecophora atra TaxID=3066294 RepID=UPI0030D51CF1